VLADRSTSVTPMKLSASKQEIKVTIKGKPEVRESTTLSQNKKRPLKDISGNAQESETGRK